MVAKRAFSRYAEDAALLLGKQIKLGRKKHRWTEQNLAERAGISRGTLQKMERGEMSCVLGLVFEVAALVGVRLFFQDDFSLSQQIEHTRDKIALLPQRIRTKTKAVDDDF